ncbi:lytic murein transglycosylase [Roseinatronobacter sp.]|uniref:lytic murein transglycosylase n=1 Tax=Roseinatronobacter sp. TaxID=1945755 RepID=UPI0025FB4397|nr:lytic murein transglycosylase [Rhodobaca sp.]
MSRVVLLVLSLSLPGCVAANVETSPRPEARAQSSAAAPTGDFGVWLVGFDARARSAGISQATLSQARQQMRYLPQTITLDRRQSEFGARIWEYLDSAVTTTRISQGQAAMRQHSGLLSRIEARFGVPPEVVVAIWGIETSFGANRGSTPILATLATLAKDGRRGAYFEEQLIDALKIVQAGDISPQAMIGSWAGAFGHTQFMPSSYLTYALDFNGNGRRDVWGTDPADALASAANYLARRGWTRGQPWAVEVSLPSGFDLGATGQRQSADAWGRAGLRPAAGGALASGMSRLILPGGARGPAFLAYDNYDVLKEYNISDAYVLALGHLSDRLRGGGALRGQWPRGDRALNLSERTELQRRLNALGHDTGGIDGRIGPATVAAVQAWQRAVGIPPDGYVNAEILARLRN